MNNPSQTPSETPSQTQKNGRFTPQTTMLEALTADPSLGMVLMRDFHLGGCRNCGFNPSDSIENVAAQNGIPTDRLLSALNREG
ncbi:MAG: hypothetical protein ABIP94_11550 [Planctomycetota bacterium]